jgi:hypothetical protein
MPSAFVAPWLQPPDFLGASEAGTRLGLQQQEMLRQSQEHADQLSATAALERDRLAASANENAQQQRQFAAAQALKEAQMKQAGLLGSERVQNQADSVSAAAELDKSREGALDRAGVQKGKDAHFQDISRQAAAEYKTAHPETSNAELMSRFPMAFKSNSEIPTVPKAPIVKPPAPMLTPGIKDMLFKQLLTNSSGGTNVDEAISGLNKYASPPAAEAAPEAAPASAADALQSAPDDGTGLPAENSGMTATPDIIQKALDQAGGDKDSARQWLQDNGYTIPPAQ